MYTQKAIAYERIIEALQRSGEFSLRNFLSLVECGEYHDDQARNMKLYLLANQAQTEIAQSINLGRPVLPKTTLDLMAKYQDESNDDLCRNWLERLEYNHHITEKYIELLAAAAKQDLQSDA